MSGMLHPVGPEEPQVYWFRRAVVAVGVVLVVIITVALARPGRSEPMAVPAASPTPLVLGAPPPTQEPAPEVTGPLTDVVGPATGSADADPAGATPEAPAVPETSAVPETPPAPPAPPEPVDCRPADLQVALAGGAGAGIGAQTTFTVTVTNGSQEPCRTGIDPAAFELRIYSGTDRIWSTKDCAEWLTPVGPQVLEPGAGLPVDIAWSGQRSSADCTISSTALLPGTYVATAEIPEAKPAQKVMGLR